MVARLPAARRCAGCSPIATGTSACRPAAGFPQRPRAAQRPVADAGLGRAQSLARAGCRRISCRASTIRPKASSPRPTRTSTRRGGPLLVTHAGARLSQAADRRAAARAAAGHAATTCRRCSTTWSACRPATCWRSSCRTCPTGRSSERLAAWDCSYAPDSLRGDAVLAAVSQRAVGDLRPGHRSEAASAGGGCCTCASRVGFSTMVLTSIDRLLHKERLAVVAGPRQGRADPPRRRAAGGRARPALGR